MNIQITDNQQQIIRHAITATGGKVEWFPDHIKGGARQKILDALHKREMIAAKRDAWVVTPAAYAVLGLSQPTPASDDAKTKTEAKPRTRDNSKQAQVIALLKRPEGATIAQIVEATGWQAHTVRGTFAGAFKKKLGLVITSDKPEGGERIYRIADAGVTA
jgi:hypothetical protein